MVRAPSSHRPLPVPASRFGRLALASLGCFAPAWTASVADELSDLKECLAFGKTSATVRYRYENVSERLRAYDAHASTVRLALGYETKPYHGVSVLAQVEGVARVGDNKLYDDSPVATTGSRYPKVLDPQGAEFNQVYARYAPTADLQWLKPSAKVGRQDIAIANQRFLGPVGWRQNHQTFDAATIGTTPWTRQDQSLAFHYGYLWRVNRITGEDARGTGAGATVGPNDGKLDMDTHIATTTYKRTGITTATAYALLLDYDQKSVAVRNLSCQTFGLRLEGPVALGKDWSALYAVEVANQSDYANTSWNYHANYYQADIGAAWKGLGLRLGYNQLDGSGATDKLLTPLATAHAFNGWAERFLAATPDRGLSAFSVALGGDIPWISGLKAVVLWYDFHTQTRSGHFGTELDANVGYRFTALPIVLGAKYGSFDGIGNGRIITGTTRASDVTKTSVYAVYAF